MSTLLEQFSNMSEDDKKSLGKASTRIKTSGIHAVTVKEAVEIGGTSPRLKVTFENDAGQTAEWMGFLTKKDQEGNVIQNKNTMNILTYICNATGTKLPQVLQSGKEGTLTFKSGEVKCTYFTALNKKKLHILTTTVVEGDDKDATKVYVKQDVDPYTMLDSKKRTAIEVASKADVGVAWEELDKDAKAKFDIHYKFTENVACKTRLAELVEKARNSGASVSSKPADVPATNNVSAVDAMTGAAEVDEDDI